MEYMGYLIAAAIAVVAVTKLYGQSVKHSAVQNAYIAKLTFQQMRNGGREDVQERAESILAKMGIEPEEADCMCEMLRYSIYALAMAELGVRPYLPGESWHHVRRPLVALEGSQHQVKVVRHMLSRKYNIEVDMDDYEDFALSLARQESGD